MAIHNSSNLAPIRLVHLQLLPLLSGVQKVTLDEFSKLDRKKYEPILVCKEAGPLVDSVRALGIDCEFIPSLARDVSPKADWLAFLELIKCFKRLRPNVVHTHSSKTGILGRLAARIAGVPNVIHTVHGFAFPFAKNRFVRWFYFMAEFIGGLLSDTVIVLNVTDYNYALKSLRLPKRKLCLIPNGVNVETFGVTRQMREAYRKDVLSTEDENEICIAMVGRLWEQKNPLCLVEAAKRVFEKTLLPVKFFFAGDGELKEEVEKKIEEYKLKGKITVLGWRSDIPTLLGSVDIFVLPSLWEGMPLAILEAMASNLAVIVSDIPGNHDLVEHDMNGRLFKCGDSEDLSVQLLKLIEDKNLRMRLAGAARTKVTNAYSLPQRMTKITKLYDVSDSLDEVGEQIDVSY